MKVPAALGYSKAVGFVDANGKLTSLAKTVLAADPLLANRKTLWLMHAGLCGISQLAPAFWAELWKMVGIGSRIARSSIEECVITSYRTGLINPDSAKVSTTAFLSTYFNVDSLADLGLILKESGEVSGSMPASPVDITVFAYAVAARWQALHPDQLTAGLDRFLEDSHLLDIFRLSRDGAVNLLEAAANRGDLELYRHAPPYQIVRRWTDLDDLARRIYDVD
jgi:hypothetical protein